MWFISKPLDRKLEVNKKEGDFAPWPQDLNLITLKLTTLQISILIIYKLETLPLYKTNFEFLGSSSSSRSSNMNLYHEYKIRQTWNTTTQLLGSCDQKLYVLSNFDAQFVTLVIIFYEIVLWKAK